jgi:hypothetical protein
LGALSKEKQVCFEPGFEKVVHLWKMNRSALRLKIWVSKYEEVEEAHFKTGEILATFLPASKSSSIFLF